MRNLEDLVNNDAWDAGLTTAVVAAFVVATYWVIRLGLPLVSRAAQRSVWSWDDVISDRRLKHRLSLLGPVLVAFLGVRISTEGTGDIDEVLRRATLALLIVVVSGVVSAVLHAANVVYESKPISHDRPIEAYVQIAQILTYLFGSVFVVAALAGQPPWFFVGGLGALTAILLLVFRDTILSLVASIQLSQADLVDIGDIIEAPDFGADGMVIDVALHAIQVQNFDKTVVAIPTHQLVAKSFKSWRETSKSGHRRIKRRIYIDLATVRFLTDEEIEHFSQFEPLRDYMAAKLDEISREPQPRDAMVRPDSRRLTNLGTLRAYMVAYLRGLDTVDTEDMVFLVRQREVTAQGVPLEIYAFTKTADWATYERIQADIFDHVIAMIPEFGMRLFQEPSGADVRPTVQG